MSSKGAAKSGKEKPRSQKGSGVIPRLGLERREVEKRIYGEKGAAHGFRNLSVIKIIFGFERPITELKTKFDNFMNEKSPVKSRVFVNQYERNITDLRHLSGRIG